MKRYGLHELDTEEAVEEEPVLVSDTETEEFNGPTVITLPFVTKVKNMCSDE